MWTSNCATAMDLRLACDGCNGGHAGSERAGHDVSEVTHQDAVLIIVVTVAVSVIAVTSILTHFSLHIQFNVIQLRL